MSYQQTKNSNLSNRKFKESDIIVLDTMWLQGKAVQKQERPISDKDVTNIFQEIIKINKWKRLRNLWITTIKTTMKTSVIYTMENEKKVKRERKRERGRTTWVEVHELDLFSWHFKCVIIPQATEPRGCPIPLCSIYSLFLYIHSVVYHLSFFSFFLCFSPLLFAMQTPSAAVTAPLLGQRLCSKTSDWLLGSSCIVMCANLGGWLILPPLSCVCAHTCVSEISTRIHTLLLPESKKKLSKVNMWRWCYLYLCVCSGIQTGRKRYYTGFQITAKFYIYLICKTPSKYPTLQQKHLNVPNWNR